MAFRTITSQFKGRCRRCRQEFPAGTRIRYGGRGMTYHFSAECGGATGASDPAVESERRYFERFSPEYQMETQGFVSSP